MVGWYNILQYFSISTMFSTVLPKTEIYGIRLETDRDSTILQADIHDEFLVIIGGNETNSSSVGRIWLSSHDTCSPGNDPFVLNTVSKTKGGEGTVVRAQIRKSSTTHEYSRSLKLCMQSIEGITDYLRVQISDNSRAIYIVVIIFTIFLSALFTGMNLGLMSLNIQNLELIKERGEGNQRIYAANILPIRKQGNFLLCTIILGNTVASIAATLAFGEVFKPITFPSEFMKSIAEIVAPSAVILIFGEIIPQVICTKYALAIGSRTIHIMVFLMVLTFPISYPASKALDWMVGKEPKEYYDKNKLTGLIKQQKAKDLHAIGRNDPDKLMIEVLLKTITNLPQKTAKEIMTPINSVMMLSDSTVIDEQLHRKLNQNRHTRIPIYKGDDRNLITGILNVKDLMVVNDCVGLKLSTVIQLWYRSALYRFVSAQAPIAQLLAEMRRGLPIVIVVEYRNRTNSYEVVGLLTLEDVLEESLGEIRDEKDVFEFDAIAPSLFTSQAKTPKNKKETKKKEKEEKEKKDSFDQEIRTMEEGSNPPPPKKTTKKDANKLVAPTGMSTVKTQPTQFGSSVTQQSSLKTQPTLKTVGSTQQRPRTIAGTQSEKKK